MLQRAFGIRAAVLAAALAVVVAATQGGLWPVAAQSGTGTVTGRVVWCSPGAPPLTIMPNGPVPQPAEPDSGQSSPGSDGQPVPPTAPGVTPGNPPGPVPQIRPYRFPAIPAGAVLVAAQNTSLSTRTDENGRFALGDLPAGQYFTVAAGPVSSAANAAAARVNVSVSAGQTVDLGTLSLSPANGAGCVYGGGPLPMSPGAIGPGAVAPDGQVSATPVSGGDTTQP